MDPTALSALFGRTLSLALIFSLGFVTVVYIPALIQLVLIKTNIFLRYKPPEYFYENYLRMQARLLLVPIMATKTRISFLVRNPATQRR